MGVRLCLSLFASLKAKCLDPRGGLASPSRCRLCRMDREAWRAAIHGVAKGWTRLSDWTERNWTEALSDTSIKDPEWDWWTTCPVHSLTLTWNWGHCFNTFLCKLISLCNKEWWKNLKLEIQWHSYYFLIMLPRESYLTSPCLNFLSVERGW